MPLTLVDGEDELSYVVDTYSSSFIPNYKNVLVSDSAGMGKSTLLKVLFLKCMEVNAGIPILIELRQLRPSFTILDNILSQLSSIDEAVDNDFVLKLIQRGDFVFFFDGFDEIPSAHEEDVVQDLNTFIDKAHNNLFVLASRPEKALASFNNFKQFSIQPLSTEEAFALLMKYGKGGETARTLIDKLKEPQYQRIGEFLSNPLLVSLLYRSYEYKATIPLKKHIFYRQVFDSLYEEHDITKDAGYRREKRSGLDIDDFHKVLRIVGFFTSKLGEVEYNKDKLLDLINEARKALPELTFNVNDFLRDLLTTVPLFVKDGHYYRWAHKSIQDYFAAQYICLDTKGSQVPIMEKMAFDSALSFKYSNIIELCYDIDYASFRRSVLYKLAQRYVNYYEDSYHHIPTGQVSPEDLRCRKEITFDRKIFIVPGSIHRKHFEEAGKVGLRSLFTKLGEREPSFYRSGSWVSGVSEVNDVALAQSTTSIDNLLHLLFSKHNKLVLRSGETHEERKLNIPLNDITMVEDRPESLVNSPIYFSEVNQLIISHTGNGELYLDIEECRTLILDIEANKKRETPDFFLDGL